MTVVTVSPKYQVVIPKDVRERLGIRPGQKVQALVLGEHIALVPLREPAEMKGFLAGLENTFEREPDRT